MTSHNTAARGADNRAKITPKTLYQHPDGGHVWLVYRGSVAKIGVAKIGVAEGDNDEGDCALVPIGIVGLKTLAYGLLTVAAEMEAAQ